jgi:hypothetical protein
MKTLPSLLIAISLPFLPSAKASYIYHWIPEPSTIGLTSGSIEITDSAYLAGSFSLADILDFKFVEPPFFGSPSIYGQTTWDIATTGSGTLTGDKQTILTMILSADYSTPSTPDFPPRDLNISMANVFGTVRSTSPFGLQAFIGRWGEPTLVSAPPSSVPDAGSSIALMALGLVGLVAARSLPIARTRVS